MLGLGLGVNKIKGIGGFSLGNVSGATWWFDPKIEASITKDGSNRISNVSDQTSNGNDIEQGTGADQPLYNASGYIQVNNKTNGEFLELIRTGVDAPIADGNDFILCFVLEFSTFGTYNRIVSSTDGGAGNNGVWVSFGSSAGFRLAAQNSVAITDGDAFFTGLSTGTKYLITVWRAGSDFKIRFDGVEKHSSTYAGALNWMDANNIYFAEASASGGGAGFDGNYYEIFYAQNGSGYDTALIEQIEADLTTRNGL